MGLTAGTRLGPYEIICAIGAGGMGEVYQARDTRLDRTVALKIVKAGFSERFEREARAISALNHPNICSLYDIGEERPAGTNEAPVNFLVMEYIDGAPLAGPRPLDQVLRYAIQICQALEAAHRAGIVHRDLKPTNILVTKAGIKLLDFGLAKVESSGTSEDVTVAALTGAHTIMGTPYYMSPEQIQGGAIDSRSDLFSLGSLLHELITGTRAFDGKSSASVLAAVLASEPRAIGELQPATPPALVWIIQRCLEKDPDARWQNAHDIALQLQAVADHSGESATGRAPGFSRRSMLMGGAMGAAVAGLAATAWLATRPAPVEARRPPVSFAITFGPEARLMSPFSRPAMTLSPDGLTVAFAAGFGAGAAIYLRALNSTQVVKVEGTGGGTGPFFSPDGQWLGFNSGGKIMRVPIKGGAPSLVCAAAFRGAAWFPDDTIVFSKQVGGLMKVAAQGGTPQPLTTLDATQHDKTHRSPVLLPGGKAIVFVLGSDEIQAYDDARIFARSLETEKQHDLGIRGYSPVYSPTGHLLYAFHGGVWARPFDPVALKTLGPAVEVVPHVATAPTYGTAEFDVSRDGTLVYIAGGVRPDGAALSWLDRHGTLTPMPIESREYHRLAVSPNRERLMLLLLGPNSSLWIQDIAQTRQPVRLTIRGDVSAPIWTSDSSRLTYKSGKGINWIPVDGSGPEEVLIPESVAQGRLTPESWSPNGQTLALTRAGGASDDGLDAAQNTNHDIMLFSVRDKKPTPFVSTRVNISGARFSPDGLWLAYVSDASRQVYVQAVSGSSTVYPVSSAGGANVSWNPNGLELIYESRSGGMMSVPVQTGASFVRGNPVLLFEQSFNYISLDPNGQRFAVMKTAPATPLTAINVMLNWAAGLARPGR
jgi:Tol biopolymer transport system component/tRNA A-37 threonylcarbamoyl transferase component Bud32